MVRRLLGAGCLLVFCVMSSAQVIVEEVGVRQDRYASAERAVAAYDYPKALEYLDPLLEELQASELAGRLQPADEALLENALELRGICLYSLGRKSRAREDFEHLVRLRPEYPLSGSVNSKIRRFYDRIRDAQTGIIRIIAEPEDAVLSVNGRDLGASYPRSLHLPKGIHHLVWNRAGYDPVEREVNVEVGKTLDARIRMVPNARTIYFLVRPQGVLLTVEDESVGTADLTADSQPDLSRFATKNGVDPGSVYVISARHLPPGEHRIRLTHPCHISQEFILNVVLDTVNNVPGYVKPVFLERKTVTVELDSFPTGAEVVLDGASVGVTPLTLPDFCIGDHAMRMAKEGQGEYQGVLRIPAKDPYRLSVALRPSLLWVGWTESAGSGREDRDRAEAACRKTFSGLERFNGILHREENPLLADLYFADGVSDENRNIEAASLCLAYGCQALLAGRLSQEGERSKAELRLVVPRIPGYDAFAMDYAAPSEVVRLLERIDRPLFECPAQQMEFVDLPSSDHPVVTSGVADRKGPHPGDLLLAVGDREVSTAREAAELLDGSGDVALRLMRFGKTFDWVLRRTCSPEPVLYGGPAADDRRRYLLSRQAVLSGESEAVRAAAGRQAAASAIVLDLPEKALAILGAPKVREDGSLVDLQEAYLQAVALSRLERWEEARILLFGIAGSPSARYGGEHEVLLQPLAMELLRNLPAAAMPLPGE